MQLGRAATQRRRTGQVPVLDGVEEGGRSVLARVRMGWMARARSARGHLLEISAQVIDAVRPAGPLMCNRRLDNGQRSGLEARTVVFERAVQGRNAREAALREVASQLVLRVDRGLQAPEELQHLVVGEGDCVALIA